MLRRGLEYSQDWHGQVLTLFAASAFVAIRGTRIHLPQVLPQDVPSPRPQRRLSAARPLRADIPLAAPFKPKSAGLSTAGSLGLTQTKLMERMGIEGGCFTVA